MPLDAATTLEVGDLVGGSRDGANNRLLDQTVERVTDTHYAIGRVTKRGTSVSNATFEFVGRADIGSLGEPTLTGI